MQRLKWIFINSNTLRDETLLDSDAIIGESKEFACLSLLPAYTYIR